MPEIADGRHRILLVWPEIPSTTYWSFSRALQMVGKRVNSPPLGLATVAAMMPEERYELRLRDLGISPLSDDDLVWADAVFVSAMIVQQTSTERLIERANRAGVPVVAGGPHPSVSYHSMPGVQHFVIGEAESVLPAFLRDWERGTARRAYARPVDDDEMAELRATFGDDLDAVVVEQRPDLDVSPIPRFDLFQRDAYRAMAVQFSRGCPVACEFCDIWTRLGRRPRIKSPERVLAELDALDDLGWTGSVFVVDDNFVGNVTHTRRILSAMVRWQRDHGYPFQFYTEASLRLADRPDLLQLMRDAAFDMVFLGIETPSQASLEETGKRINDVRRVASQVATIQSYGIEVSSGFILGFDSDPPDIVPRMVRFIQELGIPLAMVGLLMAPPGSALWSRMKREGRLLEGFSGNNTHDFSMNLRPLIPMAEMVDRYKQTLLALYPPGMKAFFDRCAAFRRRWSPNPSVRRRFSWREIGAAVRSLWTLGRRRYGPRYLGFLLETLVVRPAFLSVAFRLGIQGYHLREITAGAFELERLSDHLGALRDRFTGALREQREATQNRLAELYTELGERWTTAMAGDAGADPADASTEVGRWAQLMAELERVKRERIGQVPPALEEYIEALQRQLAEAVDSLDVLKEELLSDARSRMGAFSREYEESIRAMYESFATELDRMLLPLSFPTALAVPATDEGSVSL